MLTGASFQVSAAGPPAPASRLVETCAGRGAHHRAAGIPTVGFAAAVQALHAYGERPVRIGSVKVTDPPYHYQLFLTHDLTAVVAVLGVDQHLGYRLRRGARVSLICEVVSWVSDDFPGWIRVRLTDAADRTWFLVDKAPIFEANVTAESVLPAPAAVRGTVVDVLPGQGQARPPLLVVSTAVDGVAAEDGTDQFTVQAAMLRRLPLG